MYMYSKGLENFGYSLQFEVGDGGFVLDGHLMWRGVFHGYIFG